MTDDKLTRLARGFAADWLRPNDPDHATEALVKTLSTEMLAFHAVARGVEQRGSHICRVSIHATGDLNRCEICGKDGRAQPDAGSAEILSAERSTSDRPRDTTCSTCNNFRLLLADHDQAVQTLAADLRTEANELQRIERDVVPRYDRARVEHHRTKADTLLAVADRLDGLAAQETP